MNTKLFLALSLVLSGATIGGADESERSSIQAYDNRVVGKIEVKVENLPEDSSFDKQTVLAKLSTREGDRFSQYIFDQDLKQLAGEYDRVEPQMTIKDGKIDITLKVWLRPLISQIKWVGNQYIKTKTLNKELDVKPGTIFNRTDFNKSFNKVKEYYIKKGYFESQLSYQLIPNVKTREVEVVITVSEGRSGKVEDIVFHGFTSKEESDIIDKLYTKKYSLLTSWITGKGKFMEEALEQDRLTIFNYLQDEGYADAQVQIQILESPSEGKVVIDISADKGILYHFGEVSFNGNILLNDEDVEKVFYARPEGLYSPDKLRKTAEAIKELYGRKGYIDTNVTYETQLVQDEPTFNVHFIVDEGREYRIGMIRVIGNCRTEARVILRESLLVPGETFDSLKLKVTQMRLENIGYFKSVNVYAVRTQDDLSLGDNYRDIYIEVEETQTGNVALFGGFSSADSIYGGLDLTERNFNYRGIGRLVSDGPGALRGGGEYLHLRSSWGAKEQSYMASWMNPYFNDTLWRLGFEFVATVHNKLVSEDYTFNTYNLGAFVSYPLSPYLAYGFRYRIRNYSDRVAGRIANDPANKKNLDEAHQKGILSGVGANLTFDSTNSAMKPHRGYRSTLQGEIVGAGGNVNFLSAAYTNAYFMPLWKRGYMRYRADFRFIFPFGQTSHFDDIPMSERFFLGGVSSVRGYRDFILGPRFVKEQLIEKPNHEVKEEQEKAYYDPTGGISSSFLSIDYIQEILPILDAFVFMDAGSVSNQRLDLGTYRMSYGFGVNIELMGKMPITLGYGIPINAQLKTKRHFFFSMGGQF